MVAKIVRAGLAMFFFIVTSAAFRMPGGLQTWKCLELTFGTRQRASLNEILSILSKELLQFGVGGGVGEFAERSFFDQFFGRANKTTPPRARERATNADPARA